MTSTLVRVLIFGALAGLANVLGGAVLFPAGLQDGYKRYIRYLLSIGAGFMLAVTLFEILPNSIVLWQGSATTVDSLYIPMFLMLIGYLLVQFFEHAVAPHFHMGEEHHHGEEMVTRRAAMSAIGGLLIHAFFDGVSIAAASQINVQVGALVFIAILLHKLPEGFTIGSMILASGKGRRQVLEATAAVGFATLIGSVSYFVLGASLGVTTAYALPMAGGVALYVAASDLIPEVNHHGRRTPLVSLSVFFGALLFFATHYLLESVVGAG